MPSVGSSVVRLLGLLLLLATAACSTPSADTGATVRYKYHLLVRDSAGHYRNGVPLEPGDTPVFSYSFRAAELEALDKDPSVAARKFIEQRHAEPIECTNGIVIAAIGRLENGGVAARVECK